MNLGDFLLDIVINKMVSLHEIWKNITVFRIPFNKMESGLQKLFRKGMKIKTVEALYDMHRRAARPSNVVLKDGKPVPTNDTLPLFKYFDVSLDYINICFTLEKLDALHK